VVPGSVNWGQSASRCRLGLAAYIEREDLRIVALTASGLAVSKYAFSNSKSTSDL